MSTLTSNELEDLQTFLKDWLRHTGRTQADLRRALQAGSIRMPVLLEVLQRTYSRDGLPGLADQLCRVEELWQSEDDAGGSDDAGLPGLEASLGQLDLLLQEIRQDQQP
ncbi:hypothetical protein KBY65_12265 [Cyanobium sp. Alchichica 3B3-8F6]|uniref:hypothetical protein n=1 Tax=Synechococcales TaxID=1890424 RepID=UPI000B99C927|nr:MULTISPECIES: hypothetical protein [Synechococcales]MCP9883237.1 hypothetical protein [Cyanobium sp. Alchichica 3B3-8F6]MCP9941801.1 hypothetical protein [Cyanobium sp. ATX 6E8]